MDMPMDISMDMYMDGYIIQMMPDRGPQTEFSLGSFLRIQAMQSMLCYLGCAIYARRSIQSKLNGRLLAAGLMYLGLVT